MIAKYLCSDACEMVPCDLNLSSRSVSVRVCMGKKAMDTKKCKRFSRFSSEVSVACDTREEEWLPRRVCCRGCQRGIAALPFLLHPAPWGTRWVPGTDWLFF